MQIYSAGSLAHLQEVRQLKIYVGAPLVFQATPLSSFQALIELCTKINAEIFSPSVLAITCGFTLNLLTLP
jgi:nucleoside 2-deoxyribosyltransferase